MARPPAKSSRQTRFETTSTSSNSQSLILTENGELFVFWWAAQDDPPTSVAIHAQRLLIDNVAVEQVGLAVANAIVVGDDGVGTNLVRVSLSVDYGVLTVATAGSGVTATGNGTASVALVGRVDQLNALLTGARTARSATWPTPTRRPLAQR